MRPPENPTAPSSRNQAVVVVDDDLGFTVWVSQLLTEAGYKAVPAFSCLEAFSHIQQFSVGVDVVMVNAALPGVSDMLQTLARTHGPLRIILIKSPGVDVPAMFPAHAMLEKPRGWEKVSRQDWLRRIGKSLTDAPPLATKAG